METKMNIYQPIKLFSLNIVNTFFTHIKDALRENIPLNKIQALPKSMNMDIRENFQVFQIINS